MLERSGASGILGFETGLKNEGVAPIASRHPRCFVARGDFPAPVLLRAKERCKAGLRIEARPAEPIDRTIAADESGGLLVPDQRIILNAGWHGC